MRSKDIERIKFRLTEIEDVWSHVRPGSRICGSNKTGEQFVAPSNDPETPLGRFDSEAEAKFFATAPAQIEELMEIVGLLIKDREEALQAFREIAQTVEPAHAAFEAQEPVDMKAVIKTTRKWTRYILDAQNGQH